MAILVLSTNHRFAREIEREMLHECWQIIVTTTLDGAKRAARRVQLHCLVLDFHPSDPAAAAATIRHLRAFGMTAPILAVNVCGSAEDRILALKAGADDCVPDPLSVQELVMRIRILLHRSTPLAQMRGTGCLSEASKAYGFTAAEAKVTDLLLQGKDLEHVSAELDVSQHTVRSQLKAIFRKTGARRQAELMWLLLTSMAEHPAGPQTNKAAKSRSPSNKKKKSGSA